MGPRRRRRKSTQPSLRPAFLRQSFMTREFFLEERRWLRESHHVQSLPQTPRLRSLTHFTDYLSGSFGQTHLLEAEEHTKYRKDSIFQSPNLIFSDIFLKYRELIES